ncbi:sulfotransferase family protein [Paramaledivibacter caminithermalis]|jgi:hypothetical protein|uniref:Galactose-3-O-sulfotransferase n=1 Tax=Paramaledivibacter caminithermalis (strain DSM 15212 / CIP 107654 / DViRD3) TaxID=1121301 RepID=A0A1M6JUP9_PARC5|nr:sulfotransferase family 2 domain-containing protein [Paramaledivibacter caminithermalis]SHJ50413.1 Galactose-3-O-sulfotransferase [Paramaledivibacter caminithermalis DSM 15212]
MIINKEKYTSDVIIFIHILKTGGQTLHSIIEKQYKNNYYIKSPYWMQQGFSQYLENFDVDEIKRIEVLRGHFHFGVHKYLPQKKCRYMTFLRNPIEQVISFFYYTRTRKHHRHYKVLNNMTFDEYIKNENFNWTTSNVQTRFISGNKHKKGDFETAKKNLENYFSIVGITERFDESLSLMKKKLGWNIDYYKNKNITKNRPNINEISNETIDIIKGKNESDIKLYKFANKLLDDQLMPEGYEPPNYWSELIL